MRKGIGALLLLLGATLLCASVVIGGAFSSLGLLGFAMSLGREYGKEAWQYASLTLAGVLAGYALIRAGLWLRSNQVSRCDG